MMKPCVLVVGDEECMRNMLYSILTITGCEVFTFHAPAGLPCSLQGGCKSDFAHVCADMLIADVPVLTVSGLQFLQSLKTSGCKIPHIALMSGSLDAVDLFSANMLGAHIFSKPVRIKEFWVWLERCRKKISENRMLYDWRHGGNAAAQTSTSVEPIALRQHT